MIYAIRERETGLVKIGMCRDRTTTRRQRMPAIAKARQRETGRRSTLELLVWVDWPHDAEPLLHRYLWREWRGGEWFEDSPRLQQCLEWLRSSPAYLLFIAAFRDERDQLPGPWNWRNRDHILRQHRERYSTTNDVAEPI